jgi:glycosyltransferase involved in cell wall biosynthesis
MHQKKKQWFDGFEKHLIIVAPSKWIEGRIRLSFLRNFEITHIPNGVDTKVFNFKETISLRTNPDLQNKILFLSVIAKPDDPNKGFQWIMDYSSKVHEDIAFIVVGNNFPKKLPKNIHVIDYITSKDKLANLYRECDAYLMVSEYENYPTVCLEASATSLPIIGFDSGGVRESVIGVDGNLVAYGSPALLENINKYRPKRRTNNNQILLLESQHTRNKYFEIYKL